MLVNINKTLTVWQSKKPKESTSLLPYLAPIPNKPKHSC